MTIVLEKNVHYYFELCTFFFVIELLITGILFFYQTYKLSKKVIGKGKEGMEKNCYTEIS